MTQCGQFRRGLSGRYPSRRRGRCPKQRREPQTKTGLRKQCRAQCGRQNPGTACCLPYRWVVLQHITARIRSETDRSARNVCHVFTTRLHKTQGEVQNKTTLRAWDRNATNRGRASGDSVCRLTPALGLAVVKKGTGRPVGTRKEPASRPPRAKVHVHVASSPPCDPVSVAELALAVVACTRMARGHMRELSVQ